MTTLPAALAMAIDRQLEGVSRSGLGQQAASLSQRYRQRAGNHAADEESLAYAVTRLPATYAAMRAVLAELEERAPDFAPATLLDLGSGPGTAAWAALDAFPGLNAIDLVERAGSFRTLGRTLARNADPVVADATWHDLDLERPDALAALAGPYDLVTLGFSLVEIAPERRPDLLRRAWELTAGVLVLVDPGTPEGHGRMLAARDLLLGEGTAMLAPCPGAVACPIVAPDWCHTAVRLPRRRDHRLAKGAAMGFEDEKYAYMVLGRPELGHAAAARILRPPESDKIGVRAALCTEIGAGIATIPARARPDFKAAKKWRWGQGFDDMALVNGRLEKPRPGGA
ncbi:MAG TPA: small ribosomal subunit Rsm22 family protein [Stellaceae bacterium]|nr:small ribosomal subunit Rsm22 family protein [Stellaceae bacterium]